MSMSHLALSRATQPVTRSSLMQNASLTLPRLPLLHAVALTSALIFALGFTSLARAQAPTPPSSVSGVPQGLPRTHLARPPLRAALRCVGCPLKPQAGASEQVITVELTVHLARAAQIPLKVNLEALPTGWSLKAPLPSSLLTTGAQSSLSFDVLISEAAQRAPSLEELRLRLSYKSPLSGLSQALTLSSAEVYELAVDKPSPKLKRAPLLLLPKAPFPASFKPKGR